MLKYILLSVTALLLVLLVTPQVRRLAAFVGAVDEPGGRRMHQGRVPSLGGLALLAAVLGALCVGRVADLLFLDIFLGYGRAWVWLLIGALSVLTAGAIDDIWDLGPVPKLAAQIAAAIVVYLAGYGVSVVTNPFTGGSFFLGWMAAPITVLWVVGITNAFNLIDGLDGLAAGVALIACATLFLLSLSGGRVDVALFTATLAGALAGFLYFNFNPASIFLGDSGSMLLGYLLAVLSIQSSQKGTTAVVVLVPILALGLPIMDTFLAMSRRVLGSLRVVVSDPERNEYRFLVTRSMSVFRADRDHIHHRLLAMGLTHRRAVFLLYGVCLLLSALAFVAVTTHGGSTALLVGAVAFGSYLGVRKLGYQEVHVLQQGTLLPLFDLPVVNRRIFHAIVDTVFVSLAHVLSILVVATENGAAARGYLLNALPVVVALKLAVFIYAGVYGRTYRRADARDLAHCAGAVLAAEIVAAPVAGALFGVVAHPTAVFLLDFYLTLTLVLGARVSFPLFELLRHREGPTDRIPVLIYGAGQTGTTLLREIQQNAELGLHCVGFLDDYPGLRHTQVNGVSVLGDISDLPRLLARGEVREVLIASRKITHEHIEAATRACAPRGTALRRFRIALDELPEAAEHAIAGLHTGQRH